MAGDELARLRSGEAWRERLRAGRGRELSDERPLDLDPRSAYELMTRQMVAGLAEELREMPSNDAVNRPLDATETTRDTGTYQLPSNRQPQHTIPCQGMKRARRAVGLWHIALALAGGIVTLGAAARTLYSFIEWLVRVLFR